MSDPRPRVSLMFDVFRVAGRYETVMRHVLREGPVNAAAYAVLSFLRREGQHTPSFIAAALGSPKSSLTGPIQDLERCGLVKRTAGPRDRRSYALALTAEGEQVHQRIFERIQEILGDPPEGVDQARLRADLTTLIAHLDERIAGLS